MLICQNVSKIYGSKQALTNCQFQLKRGEILGLMGDSGSGKSTLARLLVGLEKPSKGQVLLDGKPYLAKEEGVRIMLVFQDATHAVNPLLPVKAILQEAKKLSLKELGELLDAVGLDLSYLDAYPRQLSGGQLQRICIARALSVQPDIIIFDESLSGLDPLTQRELLKKLYHLKSKYALTYLFISHDYNLCQAICHRLLVLKKGQLVDEITDFTPSNRLDDRTKT